MRLSSLLFLSSLLLVGCTSHSGVSPSQNSSLSSVSPSTTAASKPGLMQQSLDSWLKEDWIPNTANNTSENTNTTANKNENTTRQMDPATQANAVPVASPEDETPFTLQKYADKWKVYNENKEKMNAGKPKEASHVDAVNTLPVIGK